MENWVSSLSYPNYEVSTLGEIRYRDTCRCLEGRVNKHGYIIVWLNASKMVRRCDVIAETFLPKPEHDVDYLIHINGDNSDDRVSNLKYGVCYNEIAGEIWKPVNGFEGLYEISDHGRLLSLSRTVVRPNGTLQKRNMHMIVPHDDGKGYLQTTLNLKDRRRIVYIHQLVAETFIVNPENKPEINHIDGNKKNNDVANLEWVTRSENIQHAFRLGLKTMKPAFEASLLVSQKACRCVETGKIYVSRSEAERDTGISNGCICDSIKKHRPTHGLTFENV